MARFNDIKNSFLGGEVSPRVFGRTDLPIHKQSCEEILNAIVYPQGGAGRRPGTYLFDATNFVNNAAVRLVPLVISKTLAYIFVFTDDAFAVDGSNVITSSVKVINCSSGTVGAIIYGFESTTKYTRWRGFPSFVQLQQMQFVQKGTTLFVSHPSYAPFAIETLTTNSFRLLNHWAYAQLGKNTAGTLVDAEVAKSWPYDTRNTDTTITLTPAATTGTNITLTASSGTFVSGMVGSTVRITSAGGAKTGVAVITQVNTSTSAKMDILVSFNDTVATSNWAFAQWSTARGYPRAVSFFELRLMYGGSSQFPANIWGSRTGNVADFRQEYYIDDSPSTVTNADPYSVEISSNEMNEVQWLSPGKTLAIGTQGREYIASGPDPTLALGPLNLGFSPETAHGSYNVMALRVQGTVLFVQRSGEKLREILYNFQENAYKANEITRYAEHCIKKRIDVTAALDREINVVLDMWHQEADNGITWVHDVTGSIFGITRDREADVAAFHFHTIGGSFGTREAKVLSICTVPAVAASGNHDDVWMAVRRTIDGVDRTYIELMPKEFQADDMFNESVLVQNKPIYCDSAALYKDVSTLTHAFAHLPNTEVEVIADGNYLGRQTTDATGLVTLTTAATEIIVGLPYRSVLTPLGVEAGSVVGSPEGQMKRIDQVTIKFNRTLGAKFGPSIDRLQTIDFKPPSGNMNDPLPLFSGDKTIKFPAGYSRNLQVTIVQDLPLPFQVTSIVSRGATND